MIGSSKSYIYMDHQIVPYVSKDKFDLLDVATNLLKGLIKQFNSIDDLDLIKKLWQTELFFLNNKNFRKFTFPDYKPLIDPILLTRVNIKIQLENLTKKRAKCSWPQKAFGKIMGVVLSVDKSIKHHFKRGKTII